MSDVCPVDESLVQRLPLPLAQLFRRAHNAHTPLERYLAAWYLWEAGLKLLASVAVVEYADLGDHAPELAERLKNLARPQLGHWWEFIRLLVPVLADGGDPGFTAVRDLLFGRSRDDLPRAAGLDAALLESLEGHAGSRSTVRLSELFDRLVRHRNRDLGHGAAGQRPANFYERLSRVLLAGATEVLGRLDVLAGRRLLYIGEIRRQGSGNWLMERFTLIGESAKRLESLELPESQATRMLWPERIYLETLAGGGSDAATGLRSLHPLVHFAADSGQVYFLNARRGKRGLEYLCYSSGETLRREELGADHRELLAQVLGQPVGVESAEAWAAVGVAEEPADAGRPDETTTRCIGEFEILSRLGQGGMGVVYRAWQPSLGRQVALKCLLRRGDPKAEARFAREIRALGRVEHPNVVKVFTSGSEGDQWFYAMELIEGTELSRVLEQLPGASAVEIDADRWQRALTTACDKARSQETSLSSSQAEQPRPVPVAAAPTSPHAPALPVGGRDYVPQVVEIMRQVAEAAHALHEAGSVHRDIKPGNIMLTADGGHPVLMDLGLAQLADETEGRVTRTRQFVGTLRYASPEQVLAAGRVDRRTDIYSLGATLWELLTLRPLFDGTDDMPTPELMLKIQTTDPESPRKHNRHVPRDLEAIVMKCLEKDRSRRYATAADLAQDLGRFLHGEPVAAQPPSLGYLTSKFVRRYRVPLGVTAGILLLLVAGTVAAFLNIDRQRRATLQANKDLRKQQAATAAALRASEENRALAEKRFAEKRSSLDQMLKSFSDDRLKLMPGSQEIRRVFLEKGLEQYAQILGERQDDAAVKARMADSYQELGLLRSEIGAAEEARQSLQKAVEMRRQLAATAKDDAACQAALGHALFQLGQFYFEQRRLKEAVAPVQESVDLFSRLWKQQPGELAYKVALGRSLTRLASVRPGIDKEETLRSAQRLLADAVKGLPRNAEVLTDLARVLCNLSVALPPDRGKKEGLTLLDESRKAAEEALALNPASSAAHYIRAIAVNNRADMAAGGNVDDAVRLLQNAIADSKTFTSKNPAVLQGYRAQLTLQNALASLLQNLGKYDQASEVWEDIARVNEALIQRDPQTLPHYLDSIDAYTSIAEIDRNGKREAEAALIYDKMIKQAEQIMRLHPTSDGLLGRLLHAHWIRGKLSLDVQQYDKAREAYQAGVDLFTRYASSITSPGEVTHYNYFQCCRGLLQIARERKETEAAIALATKLIVPIKPDTFTDGGYKQELIGEWITLADQYEDTGNVQEAIRLRVQAMEAAKTILGGDRKSNWYAYQTIFGGYQHLARLYRKAGDERHEFEALRNHLQEAEPYVHERDHSALLAQTADLTPQNLGRLRDEVAKFVNQGGMKRFTIPTDFNGVKYPFNIYVADSWEFLEDQFTWVEKVRGGKVPKEAVDSFRKLYTIAKDNKVSYQDLCVYALGTAKGSDKTDNDNPIAPSGSTMDVNATLQELAAGRQEIQAGKGGPEAKRRLALKYIRLAEDEIAATNYFRADYLLSEARGYVGLDSFDRLQDPENNDLYSYFQLVEGALLACTGKLEKGYTEVMSSIQTEPGYVTPEFAIPSGNREFALGWICLKLQRPIESATWYRKAMELGHPGAAARIYLVCQEHPQTVRFLPDDWRKLLTRAKTSRAKDETAPTAFVRLLAEAQVEASREAALQAEKRRQERFTQFQELADLYHELADTYQTQNNRDQYRKALSKEFKARDWVMTLSPDNIEFSQAAGGVAAKLAQSYLDAKETKVAVEWMTKAAGYGHVDSLFQLADWCAKGTHIEADPKKAEHYRYLAWCYRSVCSLRLGRYADALPDLKKAGESKEADAIDCERLGECYSKLGRWAEAIDAYQRSFERDRFTINGSEAALNLMEAWIVNEQPQEVEQFVEDRLLKWKLHARNTNQLQQETALLFGFRAIAQRLLGKDATVAEKIMRQYGARTTTRELQWSWKEIDDWLKRTKVAPDRKAAVEKIVGELKVTIPGPPERSAADNAPPGDQRPAEIAKDDPAIVLVRGKNIHGDMIYCYLRIKSSQSKKLEAGLQTAGDGKFAVSEYGTVVASGKGDPPPDVIAEIHKKYPESKEIPVFYKGKDAPNKSETPVEQNSKK